MSQKTKTRKAKATHEVSARHPVAAEELASVGEDVVEPHGALLTDALEVGGSLRDDLETVLEDGETLSVAESSEDGHLR
jgi:hypothetical protein